MLRPTPKWQCHHPPSNSATWTGWKLPEMWTLFPTGRAFQIQIRNKEQGVDRMQCTIVLMLVSIQLWSQAIVGMLYDEVCLNQPSQKPACWLRTATFVLRHVSLHSAGIQIADSGRWRCCPEVDYAWGWNCPCVRGHTEKGGLFLLLFFKEQVTRVKKIA